MKNVDSSEVFNLTFFCFSDDAPMRAIVLTRMDVDPVVILVSKSEMPGSINDCIRKLKISELKDVFETAVSKDLNPIIFSKNAHKVYESYTKGKTNWHDLEELRDTVLGKLKVIDSRKWGTALPVVPKTMH